MITYSSSTLYNTYIAEKHTYVVYFSKAVYNHILNIYIAEKTLRITFYKNSDELVYYNIIDYNTV